MHFLVILFLAHTSFGSSLMLKKDMKEEKAYKEAMQLQRDIEEGKLYKRTQRALDNTVRTAIGELKKKKGYQNEAGVWLSEWENKYQNFIYDLENPALRDVGDHPGIKWLIALHDRLHFVLGDEACRLTRTHDLWKFAYTIPVVFKCVDKEIMSAYEYSEHFTMFLGATSYWVSYGVCMGISMGLGFKWACGFVGQTVEKMAMKWVAPFLGPIYFQKTCVDYAMRH